jgi:hypothetical protein
MNALAAQGRSATSIGSEACTARGIGVSMTGRTARRINVLVVRCRAEKK